MELINTLSNRWSGCDYPFLIHPTAELRFSDLALHESLDLSLIQRGDVVAIIGDFDPLSIMTLLRLIDLDCTVVPLSKDTREQHSYFFDSANVDAVIEDGAVYRTAISSTHPLQDMLKSSGHAGLVLFSTGTTGRPKAILHDLTVFLKRFETIRPTLRTLNFLLFDHIGGLNTLLHTLFNRGVVIAPNSRTVESILKTCIQHNVEVLPTTPTFLRMLLMSDALSAHTPTSLKIISYGTERMDQPTLDALCQRLPDVDFRQTFGMSELGIVRVKSEARNSLYMKIGGEGIQTRVVNGSLHIKSESRMLGYLNAESPFDEDGWYDTKDLVDVRYDFYRVVGRTSEMINVGGLKFMASEVERVALTHPDVTLVKASARDNPITGQHVELKLQPRPDSHVTATHIKSYLKERLPTHMTPQKVTIEEVDVGHRFKRK